MFGRLCLKVIAPETQHLIYTLTFFFVCLGNAYLKSLYQDQLLLISILLPICSSTHPDSLHKALLAAIAKGPLLVITLPHTKVPGRVNVTFPNRKC